MKGLRIILGENLWFRRHDSSHPDWSRHLCRYLLAADELSKDLEHKKIGRGRDATTRTNVPVVKTGANAPVVPNSLKSTTQGTSPDLGTNVPKLKKTVKKT